MNRFWERTKGLFTTAPTVESPPQNAGSSRSFRQYSMPQYDEPEGHVRTSRRIRRLKGLADQASKYPYDVDLQAIVSAFNDQSAVVRQTAALCLISTLKRLYWKHGFVDQVVKALKGVEEFDPGIAPVFIDAFDDVPYCSFQSILSALDSDLRQRVEDQIRVKQKQWNRVWIIMDDSPNIPMVLKILFKMWERTPLVLEDGYQGMQWVEDFRDGRYEGPVPELIISNIRQPGPPGYEVCGEMRKIPELNEMAIVIASAARLSEAESQGLAQVEIDHFMSKPLPMPDDLRAILEDVIEARRRKVGGQVGEGDVP